jgi:hypothetical protein
VVRLDSDVAALEPQLAQITVQSEGVQQPGAAGIQLAQNDVPETVLVFGRVEQQIGIAGAASEDAVGGADLEVRPILRTAELLEAVPEGQRSWH